MIKKIPLYLATLLFSGDLISETINNRKIISELQAEIQNIQLEINYFEKNIEFENNSEDIQNNSNNDPSYLFKNNSIDIIKNINSENSIISFKKDLTYDLFENGVDVGNMPAITSDGETTYLGAYSGNNSIPIGMISSKLFASTLILQREKFDAYSVFLGGLVRVQAQSWFGDSLARVGFDNKPINKSNKNGQNIYLSASRLYFVSNVGSYLIAEIDVNTSEQNIFSIGNAFIIMGNLTMSPFFITAGRSTLTVASLGGGGPSTGGIADFLNTGRATNISINYKTTTLNISSAFFATNDQKANFSTGLFYADNWSNKLAIGFNTGYVYNLNGAENFSIPRVAPDKTIGAYSVDANIAYTIDSGIFQLNSGWATTTNSFDFNGNGSNVFSGAWYVAGNYSANIYGRNSNFNVSYGQTYNSAAIPMTIAGSKFQNGLSKSGIKKQIILSTQRSYFDNNVLFGPEYSYQKFYSDHSHHTLSLDMSVYL